MSTSDNPTQFFYDHAGMSYQPAIETREQGHWRTAGNLADAEYRASLKDWYYSVEWDQEDPDWGDIEPTDEERANTEHLAVLLFDEHGTCLASLHGILCSGESDPYIRVVKAELAEEAL